MHWLAAVFSANALVDPMPFARRPNPGIIRETIQLGGMFFDIYAPCQSVRSQQRDQQQLYQQHEGDGVVYTDTEAAYSSAAAYSGAAAYSREAAAKTASEFCKRKGVATQSGCNQLAQRLEARLQEECL